MKKILILLLVSIFHFFLVSCEKEIDNDKLQFSGEGKYEGEYWPTTEWKSCSPENVGVDSTKLMKVYHYAANSNINTEGIIIIKDGYIIGEAYFNGFSASRRHASYSVAKSVMSSLIGIAIDKGLVNSVDEKIYQYYTQWQIPGISEEKKKISIKHLLNMTAGLEWSEGDYYGENSQDDIFRMYQESNNFIEYVLNKPIVNDPGTEWYYSSGESMLLSGIIESVSQKSAFSFGMEHLFEPLGMSGIQWESDPAGHTIGGWGIDATVREYAKIGYLFLQKGWWDGEQIVSQSWIEESLKPVSPEINYYGYQWWLINGYPSYLEAGVPENSFMAAGIYLQRIIVIPEHKIVIVRVGNDISSDDLEWSTSEFIKLVIDTLI